MEESFDEVKGVISTISGYSGGHLKNPKYADVIYTDSGHVEAVEITYDPKIINYDVLPSSNWIIYNSSQDFEKKPRIFLNYQKEPSIVW